jgi:putative Mg2+ transporter-C (MgtC) family protein
MDANWWSVLFQDGLKMLLAYVLAIPIGWDREKEERTAGVRTFPIVALASCGLALVGANIPGAGPDASSRILQGLVTGIGFVGGGAILRDRGSVQGTATAASIWSIGIAGAAVGLGLYHIGIVLALVTFLTLLVMRPLKEGIRESEDKR